MNHNFIIGSGFFATPGRGQAWFHDLWWSVNVEPYLIEPERVFIVQTGTPSVGQSVPHNAKGTWINLTGNLGHCDAMIRGEKNVFMPGCPATWMILAWLAYSNETDLVYVEQDVLAFGPWLELMYYELGNKGAIFGSGKFHGGSSTSLFLIRHHYIPTWCQDYLAAGPENVVERLAEQKWKILAKTKPDDYAQFHFGCDVDHGYPVKDNQFDYTGKEVPLPFDDWVWYAQKFTRKELLELEKRGLITFDPMPEGVDYFSNNHP